jgi:hypothetical protein
MKKNILTSIGLTTFFALGIVSLNVISDSGTTSVYAFSNGSPGAKTNSPADAANCTQCHAGSIITGSSVSAITTNIPVGGYVPGQTYTITGTVTEAGVSKFGFEMTAERESDNSKIGTVIVTDATNTTIVGGNAVTHKSSGTSGVGGKAWSFDWTAPALGTGNVTFYGAFNSANGDGATSGDKIYSSSISVAENITTGLVENLTVISTTIFPNPVKTSFEISTAKAIDNVEVYNLEGKRINNVNQTVNKFDASALASGIYFVKIVSEGSVITKKIIKE